VDSGIVLKYHWTGVKEGFKMPFSIETIGDIKSYRLESSTVEQDTVLANTQSFTFFNMMKLPVNCPHNGLTYYWTHCGNTR